MDVEENNWDFEGIVAAEKVPASALRSISQGAQHVCEYGGEAVPRTVVEVVERARECIGAKHKYALLFEQNTEMEAELVKARIAKGTTRELFAKAESRIRTQKAWSDQVQLALEKITGESSKIGVNLSAHAVAVEKTFTAERALDHCVNMTLRQRPNRGKSRRPIVGTLLRQQDDCLWKVESRFGCYSPRSLQH